MGFLVNLQRSFANILKPMMFVTWIDAVSNAIDGGGGTLFNGGTFNTIATGAADSGRLIDVPASALAALTPRAVVRVLSILDFFRWDPTSTLTPDNITVCQPTAVTGAGRFIRENYPDPTWLRTTRDYYLDATNGNDENAGTLALPVKTYAELRRRFGMIAIIEDATIRVLQIGDANSQFADFSVDLRGTGNFYLTGVLPTASFTGVLSAVTAQNITASPATSDIANAASTWTPANEVNRLIYNATIQGYSWLDADLTGGNAQVCPWFPAAIITSHSVTVTPLNAAVGNTVATYLPVKLGGISIQARGVNSIANNLTARQCIVSNFEITRNAGPYQLGGQTSSIIDFANCHFSDVLTNAVFAAQFVNCQFSINSIISGGSVNALAFVYGGHFRSPTGAAMTFTVTRGGYLQIQNDALFNNCELFVLNSAQCTILGAVFCRVAGNGPCIAVQTNGTLRWDAPSATGGGGIACSTKLAANANGGFGVQFSAGARGVRASASSRATVTGTASGDFASGGQLTAPAFDPVACTYNAVMRATTWALLTTSYAGGGFNSNLNDPRYNVIISTSI